MPGREIRREHLLDCRCLVTRTVTRVDEALLEDTAVEFVATSTIGTDHIDLAYLADSNIGCSNAAGCNAESASEYVVSGLFALSKRMDFDPFKLKAGIVGFGNVGASLLHKLDALGIDCLVCDPPLQEAGNHSQPFSDLDTILRECNFISLHVPLTHGGPHPTFHLLNAERLPRMTDSCLLVNAARGEVVDNAALLDLLKRRKDLRVFLDTWEREPLISQELLKQVDLATPHIAGYSVEGRLRGTQMVLNAVCEHFGMPSSWHMSQRLPATREINPAPCDSGLESWQDLFQQHCNIWRAHDDFVAGSGLNDESFATHFDGLRRVYPDRLEYQRFVIKQQNSQLSINALQGLGFQTES